MTGLLILAVLMLGLAAQFCWAIWHLLNTKHTFPPPTKTVHYVNLNELQHHVTPAPYVIKETPLTPQLTIPPRIISSRDVEHTGFYISGMGSSWSPARKLTPTHRHHSLRL